MRRHEFFVAECSSEEANRHHPRTRGSKTVDSKEMTIGQAFPMFSKLPKELRLKLWKMAAEEPRAVTIYSTKRKDGEDTPSCFVSITPLPAILHVCVESRGAALPKYSVLSLARTAPESDVRTSEGSISFLYINFVREVLYFRADLDNRSPDGASCIFKFVETIGPIILDKIKSIGLDINTTENCYACDWKLLAKFPTLKTSFPRP